MGTLKQEPPHNAFWRSATDHSQRETINLSVESVRFFYPTRLGFCYLKLARTGHPAERQYRGALTLLEPLPSHGDLMINCSWCLKLIAKGFARSKAINDGSPLADARVRVHYDPNLDA